MSDGTRGGSSDATLDLITTDELTSGTYSGTKAQVVKLGQGAGGAMEEISAANPLSVTGPLTDTQLRATPVPVGGNVASGVADSGNPAKVGGKYNLTPPAFADGQRGDLQLDAAGNLRVNTGALTSASDSVTAVGNVASGAADSGAPVKVSGVYNSTQPSGANGQRLDAQSTSRGELGAQLVGIQVAVVDGQSNTILTGTGQGGLGGTGGRPFFVAPAIFNGTTWDRQRGNLDGTALASAARTITTNSSDIVNYNGRGVDVILDMTVAGTGSVTMTIQGKDVLSGQYYTVLAGVAVTTIGTNVYRVYPGLVAAANAVANFILPRTWRVNCVANNANSTTYSVGYSLVL